MPTPTAVRCSAATRIRRPGRSASRSRRSARCRSGTMVRRSGAKAGDHVFVSGTIGDAALGCCARAAKRLEARCRDAEHLVSRYRVPQPRMALAESAAHARAAAMDVSDGLAGDLAKLCRASDVSADIEVARVPLSDAAPAALATRLRSDRADPDRRRGLRDPLHGRAATASRRSRPQPRRPAFRSRRSAGSWRADAPPRFLNPEGQPLTFLASRPTAISDSTAGLRPAQ